MPETMTDPATEKAFSDKIYEAAGKPTKRGAYFPEDANERSLALVESKYKDIKVYWLVNPETEVVFSTRFFAYGGTLSLAMGEALCSIVEGKTIKHATQFKPEDIEFQLRDNPKTPATKKPVNEAFAPVPELLKGISEGWPTAQALAMATIQARGMEKPKTEFSSLSEEGKKWLELEEPDQMERIETLFDRDIRPGLQSDGGDITILKLEDGYKLHVRWEGACGGCSSSAGATLSYVEDRVRKELFEGIEIVSE